MFFDTTTKPSTPKLSSHKLKMLIRKEKKAYRDITSDPDNNEILRLCNMHENPFEVIAKQQHQRQITDLYNHTIKAWTDPMYYEVDHWRCCSDTPYASSSDQSTPFS
jgi:hypothetical protein